MRARAVLGAMTSAIVCCSACGSPSGDDAPAASAIYSAVFRHLDLPAGVDGEPAIVYVVERNEQPLSLEEQVDVIHELEDEYDVLFVDAIEAVADIADDGSFAPPPDGPLVAIGPPKGDDDFLIVRAELMTSADMTDAWQLSLRGDDDVRVVDAAETDPELLVAPAVP